MLLPMIGKTVESVYRRILLLGAMRVLVKLLRARLVMLLQLVMLGELVMLRQLMLQRYRSRERSLALQI